MLPSKSVGSSFFELLCNNRLRKVWIANPAMSVTMAISFIIFPLTIGTIHVFS